MTEQPTGSQPHRGAPVVPMKPMLPSVQVFLSVATVAGLIFDSSDVQVFTVNRCTDIVEKANTSGHVTEESSISVCRKHYQSKETCGLLSEMLSLALIRGDFNKSSFCEMMSSAHGCSAAMEDFLSSDVVADLAFGHCRRLRQNKTAEYCHFRNMGQAESREARPAPWPKAPSFGPDEDGWLLSVNGERCFQMPEVDPLVRDPWKNGDLQQLSQEELEQLGQRWRHVDHVDGENFLSQWMGLMLPVIGHKTLWELCLPGTHDTLTYDLSDRPAIGDSIPYIGLLEGDHFPSRYLRNKVSEEVIVKVSKCQTIDVEGQLRGGIRFMDFRVIYSRGRWMGVHGLETQSGASQYLQQICRWLHQHPQEIVVLWLSRHGNEHRTGSEQYPNTSVEVKQSFFHEILGIFDGLVVDREETPLETTAIRSLVERNKRLVLICSDWEQFTGCSSKALDAAVIENHLPGGFDDPVVGPLQEFCDLSNGSNGSPEEQSKYHIVSLANAADEVAVKRQIMQTLSGNLLKLLDTKMISPGKSKFDYVPELVELLWRLDHSARFTNYHAQIVLETVWSRCHLPQAIYIDMVTDTGGIEIGDGCEFGYVDTILAYNVLHGRIAPPDSAGDAGDDAEKAKKAMLAAMLCRKSLRPLCRWEDRWKGRSRGWPLVPCVRPFADPTAWFHIRCKHSDWRVPKVWDIAGAESGNGAKLIQYTLNNQANQKFRFEDCGDGYFKILVQHAPGLALDVEEQVNEDGTRLHLWTDHGGPSQQFRFDSKQNGFFQVVSRLSQRALDIEHQSTDSGAPVHLWRFKGVLSAAVKASETVDTLRECYMLELEQKSESTTATTTPTLFAAAVEAVLPAKIGGIVPAVPVVTAQPVVAIAKVPADSNQSRVPNVLTAVNASNFTGGVNASMMALPGSLDARLFPPFLHQPPESCPPQVVWLTIA
eukprot:s321_g14.t1